MMEIAPPLQKSFVFYLVPEFTLLAFTTAVEALRLANEAVGYAAYSWRIATDDGQPVKASCRLAISPHSSINMEKDQLNGWARPSVVLVCAGKNVEKYCTKSGMGWLRECRQHGVLIGSLCTGTHILAQAGLLNGKKCTIHWENLPGFTENFSNIAVKTSLYETDGGIYTAAGGTATFDLMMHLVAQDLGETTVSSICEQALVERVRAPTERQRIPLTRRVHVENSTVLKAIALMESDLAEPSRLKDLAKCIGISRRQLERLFQNELGSSPARYYLRLRLERARLLLLQTRLPVIEVAAACGFISGSHFARTYRLEHSLSPHATRETVRSSRSAAPLAPVA